jgi:hypothetical protein
MAMVALPKGAKFSRLRADLHRAKTAFPPNFSPMSGFSVDPATSSVREAPVFEAGISNQRTPTSRIVSKIRQPFFGNLSSLFVVAMIRLNLNRPDWYSPRGLANLAVAPLF